MKFALSTNALYTTKHELYGPFDVIDMFAGLDFYKSIERLVYC